MSEYEMRTVANTLAAVGLSWNPAGRKPADMYRAMADRLADAGLLQSPETAAEHERTRVERNTAVSTVAEQAQQLARREREHNADRVELERLRSRVAELEGVKPCGRVNCHLRKPHGHAETSQAGEVR